MHAPGLKVVAPSTPADAKGLLAAAIRDPNPVIFWSTSTSTARSRERFRMSPTRRRCSARVARAGDRPHRHRLRRDGARRARGRRGARRRARSRSSTCARSFRSTRRRSSSSFAKTSKVAGRRRGQRDLRRGRPGRGADRRSRLRVPRRRRSAGSPRPTCRSPSARRSSRPCFRASTRSRGLP